MPSPISEERSDLPSPDRQKMEEITLDDSSDSDSSEDGTPEEIQLFYDEWNKSQGFEIDFSKLSYCSTWQPLDLDDSTMVDEPETNRDFIAMLSNLALTKHNAEHGTSLELGNILRANFHPSAGMTLYISFEVNDPSSDDANQAKPYRAVVRYLPGDIEGSFSISITISISAIEHERSEAPSPKRPKLEETSSKSSNDEAPPADSSYDSDDWETLSDDFRLLDEEWDKSGGFDVDLSKLRHTFGYGSVDLDESDIVSNSEPHDTTNRDLLNRLSNLAISHYHQNTNTDTRLQLVKVLRANFHPSAAITLYITFEAYHLLSDADHNNQTYLYQAVVRYLPWDIEVCSCWPAPSAS